MPLDIHPGPATTYPNGCVRRYPRALFSVPVTLHHPMAGGVSTLHGISLDISKGGLGALVQASLDVGEVVEIDLQLPERMLSAYAIVRDTSRVRSGFEFLGLTAEKKKWIAEASCLPRTMLRG